MSLFDNLKAKIGPVREKMSDLAHQQGDRIQHGIDKAAHVVDEKTKGKYSEKIHTGSDKAKHAMDRLAHNDGHEASHGTNPTPPDTPPPPTS
ncbi:antitoxin [Streptomyces sp. NPDC046805]|uniref:antitoxin n=1 Tax=Streptomyces sp. NPDC046805 TaxID=3155134 RepID=UPI0033D2FC37